MSPIQKINALVLDIDGVLTDGRVALDPERQESKGLFYRDIDAVFEARREGLKVALVTGEESPMVDAIARYLAIDKVVPNAKDKVAALSQVCSMLDIPMERVCYVGDADRDAPALAIAGLGLAPSDASESARQSAHTVLTASGGRGAVAEALKIVHRFNGNSGSNIGEVPVETGRPRAAASQIERGIVEALEESVAVKQAVIKSLVSPIAVASQWIIQALDGGHKLLLFGNGGSAADAQHMAAEFVGRFRRERAPWPAIALTTDTSVLTALGNDYGVEVLFARQVEALAQPGDVVVAFSTSGNSSNVIQGVVAARECGAHTIGLTGEEGGRLAPFCDLALRVPSKSTARIQECHIAICDAICEVVEVALLE